MNKRIFKDSFGNLANEIRKSFGIRTKPILLNETS